MRNQILTNQQGRAREASSDRLTHVKFSIPLQSGGEEVIPIFCGRPVFVVGPNGSGKSSLLQILYKENKDRSRRITAHRQTWFESNAIRLSPARKLTLDRNIPSNDSTDESRWRDYHASERIDVTLFELVDSEITRAIRMQAAVDSLDVTLTEELRKEPSPISKLNKLLRIGNLPIIVSIEKDQQLLAEKEGSEQFSIAELSDGERNAVLLAADVLTASPGTLILIDEPERHLHRSIASPLLISLFEERSDCGFVISTHDVTLPTDTPNATTVLLRSCTWTGQRARTWDADIVDAKLGIGDETKREILGSRRKILFVEGDYSSIDQHTYTVLYPEVSVVPKGSCAEVIRAVMGIRNSESLHWIKAYGLIDRDSREEKELDDLAERSIFALDCYSIESLYYCSEIIARVAERQLDIATVNRCVAKARDSIIEELSKHKERLCSLLTVKRARNAVELQLPTYDSLLIEPVHRIEVDASDFLAEENQIFDAMVLNKDTDGLIERYNCASTGALDAAAKHLGFLGHWNYEGLVRKLLNEDETAREYLRQRLSALTRAIKAQESQSL